MDDGDDQAAPPPPAAAAATATHPGSPDDLLQPMDEGEFTDHGVSTHTTPRSSAEDSVHSVHEEEPTTPSSNLRRKSPRILAKTAQPLSEEKLVLTTDQEQHIVDFF